MIFLERGKAVVKLVRNTWRHNIFNAMSFLSLLFLLLEMLIPQQAASVSWTLYKSDIHGFELSYPNDWAVVKTQGDSVFNLQNQSSGIGVRIANLQMDEKTILTEMSKNNNVFIIELRHRFPDAKTILNQRTILGGRPSNCIIIEYSLKNIDALIKIRSATITCPKGGKLYTIQFDSLADEFRSNYNQFQKIIATFNFR